MKKIYTISLVFIACVLFLLAINQGVSADTLVNVALNKPTSATLVQVLNCNNNPAWCGPSSLAVDGNTGTWWATGNWDPASLTIDLQSEYSLTSYEIWCGGTLYAGNYGTIHFFNAGGTEVATKSYVCHGVGYTLDAGSLPNVSVKTIKIDARSGGSASNASGGDWINVSEFKAYANACTSHSAKQCSGNAVYWYNSCGTIEDIFQQCTSSQTCQNAQCVNITCSSNADCGTSAYTGSPFCQNNNVYQNYITYTCNNPGTSSSSCANSTSAQLKNNCTGNQTCSNGSCGQNCTYHSYQQCSGNNLYWFDSCGTQQDLIQYCQNGCQNNACIQQNVTVQTNSATNIYNNQATLNGYLNNYNSTNCNNNVWFQYGPSTGYGSKTTRQSQNYTGNFSQNVNLYNSYNNAYHFRAAVLLCNGTTVYGQDMTFTAGGTSGNLLTINKTARNLTSGNSNWSNTAYANPSDMLMFMITIQANGNQDVNNVFVRDSFPANLIYKNQLVVACTSNNSNSGNCNSNNYNYSGDIISGINLNTIYAGQTVTITYQAQVASLQNFSYGTTTLNNSVTVSSSGSGNNPVSNASISVTRSAVYGASTIATGLTDNLFVDSFVLPLMAALAGIWMFRSGMFVGVEKWAYSRKKTHREYRAQKTLNARISQIREAERA